MKKIFGAFCCACTGGHCRRSKNIGRYWRFAEHWCCVIMLSRSSICKKCQWFKYDVRYRFSFTPSPDNPAEVDGANVRNSAFFGT